VNRHLLALALSLTLCGAAQAATVDLTPTVQAAEGARTPAAFRQPLPASAHTGLFAFEAKMSELPEPEVFAMMLLGLILIGYRASRDSDEKFE
jgi:hypothetical protein